MSRSSHASTPSHVLGDWQHVPRVATLIRAEGERWADVRTYQHWSILDAEDGKIVRWRVMMILPPHIAPYPLVFEDRADAKRWVDTTDEARDVGCAADIAWTPPSVPENGPPEKVTHHSLRLYPAYNGGGVDNYAVPAGGGVADWAGKQPGSAGVPDWLPLSFETFDRNDRCNFYGHEHGKARREQHVYVVGVQQFNLPFPVLDSVSSKY
jgi:hypothetical protein